MKYGILGDIHSNLEAFEAVVKFLKEKKVERYICTGDLIGYGPDPSECVELFRSLPFDIYIGGNHEDQLLFSSTVNMNPIAMAAIIYTFEKLSENDKNWIKENATWTAKISEKIAVSHGSYCRSEDFLYLSHSEPERKRNYLFLKENGFDALFVGHTHSPSLMIKNEKGYPVIPIFDEELTIFIDKNKPCMIDVGSVGQPRDGDSRACFAIYDSDNQILIMYRTEYDIQKTYDKIMAVGLPESLAKRLIKGR